MPTAQRPGRVSAILREHRALAALSILFVSGAVSPSRAAENGPVVSVTGGLVRGVALEDGKGAVFKGVPFAEPPLGMLRWREPQPVVGWGEDVREAYESGPPAAQPAQGWNNADAAAGSEDCLYLDVWTPSVRSAAHLPVMVWIHGGANVAGAGGFDPLYDGRALIGHGVVLVVVEYRLGVFGFFSHPELTLESPHHASGNYGLMDQVAALQWVHDNIANMGGDPDNVTLFGQSAGSMDVLALMASPLARGLFQKAIAESGPSALGPHGPAATLATTEQAGVALAAKLNAPATGTLAYLRSLATDTLLNKLPGTAALSADGWVLPSAPLDVFAQGKESQVPLIIGSNAIEFPANGGPEQIKKMMQDVFGDLTPRALVLYGLAGDGPSPKPDPVYGNTADQWGSDLFRCPAVVQGEWHSSAGNPTWEYQFDRAIPPNPRTAHSGDLPYVFGNLPTTGGMSGKYQDADRALSGTIQAYWTQFAKTGNPNGPGVATWPQYNGKTRKYLNFTAAAEVAVAENQRGAICDLFREALRKQAGSP